MRNSKGLLLLTVVLMVTMLISSSVAAAKREKFAAQFTLEEVLEYKSLSSYNEAPELAELVKAGKLPPVEERLPKQPRVLKANIMYDGIGQYGGVWRDTFAVPVESWNWGAGQTQGWFGINQIVQESLVQSGPMWFLKEPNPVPNLATSWEWSEDGKTLTMHLIEGAKWSDGVPFTADDVLFTYEHYILDPKIPSWKSASAWTFNGELTKLEKVDDYTIRWHFPVAYPVHALFNMDYLDFSVVPKHVYEKFHPAFNPEMTYDDLLKATPPQDLPPVTLGPWVPVRYEPGQLLVMVRNPYYWQVDENGNQLPYINEVWFTEATSGETRTMNVINGTGDRTNLENPQTFSLIKQASLKPGAQFNIRFEPFGIGYHLMLNFSNKVGVETDRDRALRELFRNLKFRQALSHAIDREGMAQAVFPGPLVQPWYGGYPSGSPYYDESVVTRYEYNPEKTVALLKELGFEDTDNDGIVNWPDGTLLAGKNLNIELITGEDQSAAVEAAEALVPMFREVGIDLRVKVLKGPVVNAKINGANFEAYLSRMDTATPFVNMDTFGPVYDDSPSWHIAGPGGERELLPFEKRIREIMLESRTSTDLKRRKEIFTEVLKLYTENVYSIGLYEARRGLAIHNRLRNVQPDVPIFLYNWNLSNFPVQIIWVRPEDQFEELYQQYIPTAEDYQGRSWQQ